MQIASFKKIVRELEIRRQLVHLLFGVSFVLFINKKYLPLPIIKILLLIILVSGIALSSISRRKHIHLIHPILAFLERKEAAKTFPGKGAFFYFAGVLYALIFFPPAIASASIMILALGDSISHIIGRYYGRTRMIISRTKVLEGSLAGFIAGTLGAMIYVPFPLALSGAFTGMLVEAIELGLFHHIDDNFTIPVVAGLAMTLFSSSIT